MNEAMKSSNVQSYFNKLGVSIKSNVIYAQIDAQMWQYLFFSPFAALAIKHFLLCFEEDRIVVVGVTTLGDFADKNEVIIRDIIQSISYKKGVLNGKLNIKTENETYAFLVPKVTLVAPWHKGNLETLLESDFK